MAGKVLLPPHYESVEGGLIFLGGPIKGAPLWQNEAIKIIRKNDGEINIASPSRKVDSVYLEANQTPFRNSVNQEEWEQVDWESFHLDRAAENGCILFWLPPEAKHFCERAYAQTSRVEIGEWKVKHKYTGCNVVIGFERGFSGEHYLRYRLRKEYPNIPVCSTLEETCFASVEKVKRRLILEP